MLWCTVGLAGTALRTGSLVSLRQSSARWTRRTPRLQSSVPGSTDARDDALHPLLTRTGVCRDYAHLGVALCRALGIPARYAAVYAPGLSPMDFHAVFEAAIDGRWYVFDGTRLAPRRSLTRIASGRDAADTAFLTPLSAVVGSVQHDVTVTADPDLPVDDRNAPVPLA